MPPDNKRRSGGSSDPPPCRRTIPATLVLILLAVSIYAQDKQYPVKGMVVRVDAAKRSVVVSHETIAALRESMVSPFEVGDAKDLQGVHPGAIVEFILTVGSSTSYASR